MLYHLLYPLHTTFSVFNVFRYITFRTIYAVLTALVISFVLGPWLIRLLKKESVGQYVRDDGPSTHFSKTGTPTMGGLLILFSVSVSTLLWADLTSLYVWIALLIMAGFGGVGFLDDYLKIRKKGSAGLTACNKILIQSVIAFAAAGLLYCQPEFNTHITIPFFKNVQPDIGWGYILFAAKYASIDL